MPESPVLRCRAPEPLVPHIQMDSDSSSRPSARKRERTPSESSAEPSTRRRERAAHVRALVHEEDDDGLRDEDAESLVPERTAFTDTDRMLVRLMDAPTDDFSPSLEDLQAVFAKFRNGWIGPKSARADSPLAEAAELFGDTVVDGRGRRLRDLVFTQELETAHLDKAYKTQLWVLTQLKFAFGRQNLLELGGSSLEREGREDDLGLGAVCNSSYGLASEFKAIRKAIRASHRLLKSFLEFQKNRNPRIDSGAPDADDGLLEDTKFSPFHELVLFVLDHLKESGFRKFRGTIWRAILSDPLPTGELNEDGSPKLERVDTHAWEPVMVGGKSIDLEQFITSVVKKEDHATHWTTMTTGANFQNLVTFLRDRSDELEFQTLRPDRDFISFKNGILDIRGVDGEGPRFFTFPLQRPLRVPDVVSNNFIAGHFGGRGEQEGLCNGWPSLQDVFNCGRKRRETDPLPSTHPDMYKTKERRDMAPHIIDWMSMYDLLNSDAPNWDTPTFNSIFLSQLMPCDKEDGTGKVLEESHTLFWSQAFPELVRMQTQTVPDRFPSPNMKDWTPDFFQRLEAREYSHMIIWHYALLGRLLFRVNDKDSWQVIQMIKGVAGCGKSTILNLVGKFFRPEDVETLSNQTRGGGRAIGVLETVWDKFLWRVYEIKENFGLDQSAFQSMVSGEIVPIDRLHQKTISVAWTVPGILAGNEFGGWRDNSGSILRRVLVSNFAHIIDEKTKDPLMPTKLDKELPAILHKCLLAYCFLATVFKGSDVWQVVPEYFRWTRTKLSAASDPLASFLASTSVFVKDPSCCVPLTILISAFKEWGTAEGISRHQMASVSSGDEDKLKPSLATQKLQFVRVTASNRAEVEESLQREFQVPSDWNKGKGYVVVRGLRKMEEK